MKRLQDILIEANAYLDLDATLPVGTELTTRSNYANRALWEATAIAQFRELQNIYVVGTESNATFTLPTDFREFQTAPRVLTQQQTWEAYEQIDPQDIYSKSVNDKYFYVLGNPASGYNAVFNALEANCTLHITYQRYPSGLLTLTDICELPDPEYVTAKVESFVLQSRRDERFPVKDAEAERRLKNMVGRSSKSVTGGTNTTRRIGVANYIID
jgi:hypothetical protein